CLATPRGTRALIEAGRDQGLDLAEELAALGNAHERALACSLNRPRLMPCSVAAYSHRRMSLKNER
ncbi:MAG: hypothetical protein ACPL7K_00045, partial [Armatimonadota bacterium]